MCDWLGGFVTMDSLVDWQMNESPAAQHEGRVAQQITQCGFVPTAEALVAEAARQVTLNQ